MRESETKIKETKEEKHADKNIYDRLLFLGKVFFLAFLAITVAFIIVYSFLDENSFKVDEKITYIEHWIVNDGKGNTFEAGRSFRDNKRYTEAFSIESKLPDDIEENEFICFGVNIELDLYINGELRYSVDNNNEFMLPGGHVKKFYVTVPLTQEDSGATVKMVRFTNSNQPEVVPVTVISTMSGIYRYLFGEYGRSFCLSLILLAFSIAVVLVSLGMMIWYKRKIIMLFGALGILIVAAWLVTNSYLYPFVFGHYHVDGAANYMFCLMIPFGFDIYLNYIQNGRFKKVMALALIASVINAAFWTVLNFTGIFPFIDALFYIDQILGLLIIIAVIILIIDIKNGNIKHYKYTAIGFALFLISCIIELISIASVKLSNDDIPMLVGLALLLVFVVIQQVEDLRVSNIEKQRAIDLSDAKTRFLASMSHEIRTPINSILGMNEIILRENKDEVIDHYSKTIRSSGRILLTLVNDVLDFSKIESGKIEIIEEEYNLSRVFSEILPMMAERAGNKELDFKTCVLSEIPDGQIGDEYRLKQILINLLSNAIKYTDNGFVEVMLSGKYLNDGRFMMKISVEDSGRGIKKDELDTLFNAFYRADRKRNRSIEGTGLGLAIVKNILDAMGGEIRVESDYGKGSIFTVTIPVGVYDKTPVSNDFSNDTTIEEEYFICDYTSDAKVLAVDDNKSNLTIVKLFLREAGIEPEIVLSGKEAIELCHKNKYDLILLDHMMPAPDGMETLEDIKNNPESKNKNTKVLVLTANAIAGSREMFLAAGFDDYLIKPIDSKKLIKTVKKFLPPEKIHEKNDTEMRAEAEAALSEKNAEEEVTPDEIRDSAMDEDKMRRRMVSDIAGFDYQTAMIHCAGDKSLFIELLNDITREASEKAARMRDFVIDKKFDSYAIDAHSMKSNMATVGIMNMSERAKKHELAAKSNEIEFIEGDYEAYLKEYEVLCKKIAEILADVN